MIVYNVTYSVDKEIAEDWISWMKDKHIPDVLKQGLFVECKILKVLTHDDNSTFSYAVQYSTDSLKNVEKYLTIEDEMQVRYGERVLPYPTLLEEI